MDNQQGEKSIKTGEEATMDNTQKPKEIDMELYRRIMARKSPSWEELEAKAAESQRRHDKEMEKFKRESEQNRIDFEQTMKRCDEEFALFVESMDRLDETNDKLAKEIRELNEQVHLFSERQKESAKERRKLMFVASALVDNGCLRAYGITESDEENYRQEIRDSGACTCPPLPEPEPEASSPLPKLEPEASPPRSKSNSNRGSPVDTSKPRHSPTNRVSKSYRFKPRHRISSSGSTSSVSSHASSSHGRKSPLGFNKPPSLSDVKLAEGSNSSPQSRVSSISSNSDTSSHNSSSSRESPMGSCDMPLSPANNVSNQLNNLSQSRVSSSSSNSHTSSYASSGSRKSPLGFYKPSHSPTGRVSKRLSRGSPRGRKSPARSQYPNIPPPPASPPDRDSSGRSHNGPPLSHKARLLRKGSGTKYFKERSNGARTSRNQVVRDSDRENGFWGSSSKKERRRSSGSSDKENSFGGYVKKRNSQNIYPDRYRPLRNRGEKW